MKIKSIHLCTYEMEDLYNLVEKDLQNLGYTLANKIPTSKVVEGKTVFVFEATSNLEPKQTRGKGKGGRPKREVAPVQDPAIAGETGVVAPAGPPFPSHPVLIPKLRQVG